MIVPDIQRPSLCSRILVSCISYGCTDYSMLHIYISQLYHVLVNISQLYLIWLYGLYAASFVSHTTTGAGSRRLQQRLNLYAAN